MAADEDRLLIAIEEVRDEGRERDKKTEQRFIKLETKIDDVSARADNNTRLIVEQAAALTRVANAAAGAAEMGLDAKQRATRVIHETTEAVAGALRIQSASLTQTVDDAVRNAMIPLIGEVDLLKKSEQGKTQALIAQDSKLLTIEEKVQKSIDNGEMIISAIGSTVKTIAGWKENWQFKFIFAVAVLVGAALGGYYAAPHTVAAPTQQIQ